jgi:HNH endonuclease
MAPVPTPVRGRFEEKYIPEPNSGCFLWMGAYLPRGYGIFWLDARRPHLRTSEERFAHRVSWILNKGDIPAGLKVLHRCDNPCCVNVDHLFLGTQKDNAMDREAKGRGVKGRRWKIKNQRPISSIARGERNGSSKLFAGQVLEIRASQEKLSDLAARFGVSYPLVSKIRRGVVWKHLQ